MRRRWPWWIALAFAVVLVLIGAVAREAEDATSVTTGQVQDMGHTVSWVLFVIAAVIGIVALLQLFWDDES